MAKNKKVANLVEAGVVGAVVGAAIGATAVALSDSKNRKKLGKKFEELKKDGAKVYSDLKDKVNELSAEGKSKVKKVQKALKK